ncbi:hypothetical protein FKM82_011551 [Ascaphus truei]
MLVHPVYSSRPGVLPNCSLHVLVLFARRWRAWHPLFLYCFSNDIYCLSAPGLHIMLWGMSGHVEVSWGTVRPTTSVFHF